MTSQRIDLSTTQQTTPSVAANMDPRLQLVLARRRAGLMRRASSSTDTDEIGVIARVTDTNAWTSQTDVRDPVVIGAVNATDTIVTGRIPIPRIEMIRQRPFIKSLKAATPIRPMLAATTSETEAQPTQLPSGHHTSGGKGVVVGIVDYGGDFAHENFLKADGTTRLLSLWDQNGGSSPSSPFGYGKEHTAASMNLALNQADPYGAINYDPADFEFPANTGSHGTHVMDIAAGNGRGSGVPGMAPEADLMFVNITHDKDPSGADVVGESFGDSVALLEALKYIFDKAGSRPAVINVSLGTNGGPHDGSTLVEQGIDALVTAQPNRAVVLAASNSFDDGIHAAGTVGQGTTVDLVWDVNAVQLNRDIEMEVWFAGTDQFRVELLAPDGTSLATANPGETKQVTSGAFVAALVANRLNDPNNGDNMIGVFLAGGMPVGQYKVRLTGVTVTNGAYHAWIERDNASQSQFLPPHDNTHTIGSVSCGKKLIAVGSYDAHVSSLPLSFFSSAGPTRDGRQKPEVSAPGHHVWAAKSSTKTGVTRKMGTSMAAPAVAGLIALIFEEAKAQGLNLSIDQTISILQNTARRNPPSGTAWHNRYGAGRIHAAKAIKAVMDMAGGSPSPAPVPAGNATDEKPKKKKKKDK